MHVLRTLILILHGGESQSAVSVHVEPTPTSLKIDTMDPFVTGGLGWNSSFTVLKILT